MKRRKIITVVLMASVLMASLLVKPASSTHITTTQPEKEGNAIPG